MTHCKLLTSMKYHARSAFLHLGWFSTCVYPSSDCTSYTISQSMLPLWPYANVHSKNMAVDILGDVQRSSCSNVRLTNQWLMAYGLKPSSWSIAKRTMPWNFDATVIGFIYFIINQVNYYYCNFIDDRAYIIPYIFDSQLYCSIIADRSYIQRIIDGLKTISVSTFNCLRFLRDRTIAHNLQYMFPVIHAGQLYFPN